MRILGLLFLIAITQFTFAQSDKEIALSKAHEAIKLMDNGKIDESIKLLKEAQKLDPNRFDYPYELAYAHYIKKDYSGAIKILKEVETHKDITERFYQLLGNSYDILGKTKKAFEVYDTGLEKFPNSGMIYLEKGNVYWGKEEFDKALPFYEKGIELDPAFPSNYYRATLIYLSTTEEVWGMIYGEIFMNIERNSKRTSKISKLLFDTYESQIKFTSDTSFSVSFSQNAQININDLDNKNFRLPFGIGVYEPTLMMSMINEKTINQNSLYRIRENFINSYFDNKRNKDYPNILFDYQKKVIETGHFEAYSHWILMKGDEDGFDEWYKNNKEKWEAFIAWFTDNGMKINKSNKFYRGQY